MRNFDEITRLSFTNTLTEFTANDVNIKLTAVTQPGRVAQVVYYVSTASLTASKQSIVSSNVKYYNLENAFGIFVQLCQDFSK